MARKPVLGTQHGRYSAESPQFTTTEQQTSPIRPKGRASRTVSRKNRGGAQKKIGK